MAKKTISIAFLGSGNIAQRYANELKHIEGVQVVAVVGQDTSLLQKFLSANPEIISKDVRCFSDHREALDWGKFDAAYICTWHDSHVQIGVNSLRAGKAVFMEKPMALSLESGKPLVQAFLDTGSNFIMGGLGFRYYNRSVFQLRHFLKKIKIIQGRFISPRWPDAHWALDPIHGGGVFFSVGAHLMDMACVVAGSEPVRITAAGGAFQHPGNLIDSVVCHIEFENGALASLAFGDCGEISGLGEMTLEAYDGNRSVRINEFLPTESKPVFTERKGYYEAGETWSGQFDGLEELPASPSEDFIQSLRNGQRSAMYPTMKDAVRSVALLEKAAQSSCSGLPVMIEKLPAVDGYYR